MSKTVLVTGISGFIGLYCAKELLEKGYKVIGTVRNSAKREEVINTFKKNDINLKNLTFEILEPLLEVSSNISNVRFFEFISFFLNVLITSFLLAELRTVPITL